MWIFFSDRDTPSPWERNILIDVDRMTSSLEHVWVEDIERLEHPSPLTIDCQYNESSSAGWKGSSFTNSRTLENLHIDETAEGSLNLNLSQADKR